MPDKKTDPDVNQDTTTKLKDAAANADAPKPTAEVAVASPIDGSPIPATEAQANATTSNTQDKTTDGAAQVQGQTVGEAYTGTPTDPYFDSAKQAKDEADKKASAPYVATKGFRHGIKDGREIAATAGETLGNLSAAEAKELTDLGLIEKNPKK